MEFQYQVTNYNSYLQNVYHNIWSLIFYSEK